MIKARQLARREIRRICYAGYDPARLGRELARRIRAAIPAEAVAVSPTDPELGLMVSTQTLGIAPEVKARYIGFFYPRFEAVDLIDLARAGRPFTLDTPPVYRDIFDAHGLGGRIAGAFPGGENLWALLCVIRERGAAPFGDEDLEFLHRIAPHVAEGFRQASLIQMAGSESGGTAVGGGPDRQPGVAIVDDGARIVLRDVVGARALLDLSPDDGWDESRPPPAVGGALAQLYCRHRLAGASETPLIGRLRARGRSGEWYELTASLAEPDATGATHAIIVIAPAQRRSSPGSLCRLYGLSPREHEVLVRIARGESTKAIALALGVSTYTVQDHVGNASAKVGVRSRRELVARLFIDQIADRFTIGHEP